MSHRHTRNVTRRPAPAMWGRRRFLLGAAGGAIALLGAGVAWRLAAGGASPAFALAPESVLPPDIRRAPAEVREAYRFAVANRDILRYVPCFCGCGDEGHTSNASCYLTDASTPGTLVFDRMSLG